MWWTGLSHLQTSVLPIEELYTRNRNEIGRTTFSVIVTVVPSRASNLNVVLIWAVLVVPMPNG